jgi:hypothetical protein
MEILFAIGVSLFLQAYKWVSKKFGKTATKNVVYLLLFAVSLAVTILTEANIVSWEAINEYGGLLLLAVGFYEGIIKRLAPFLSETVSRAVSPKRG